MKKLMFIAVLIMNITIAARNVACAQYIVELYAIDNPIMNTNKNPICDSLCDVLESLTNDTLPPFGYRTSELPDTLTDIIMFTIDSVRVPILIEYIPNLVTIEQRYFACGPDGKVDVTKEINAMDACFNHLNGLIIDYDGHKKAVAQLKQKIDFITKKPKPVESSLITMTMGEYIFSLFLAGIAGILLTLFLLACFRGSK
jgi:hypothetical protein